MKHSSIMVCALFCMFALTATAQKYVGGDISLLPSYEQNGAKYLDQNGTKITDMLTFFKQKGWNAMRVRLFVDPSKAPKDHKGEGVRQDLAYVTALGKRIKQAGFKFMLDFHYSDTWTDPGKHSTPSAWSSTDPDVLADNLADYTTSCLNQLKAAGAEPDFIQTGNEITYGMLWPTGHCYPNGSNWTDGKGTWGNFAKYLKAATEACRTTCPKAKIVLQTEMSRATNVTNFYKTAKAYSIDYDIIGISYYPYYHGGLSTMEDVINQLETAYPDKKIEIVETGYYHKWYPDDAKYSAYQFNAAGWSVYDTSAKKYDVNDECQRKFAADLVEMLNKHASVDGLYWWWPEANECGLDWSTKRVTDGWYNASLWDNQTGRALPAIDELKAFAPEDTGINTVHNAPSSLNAHPSSVYDLQGRRVEPTVGVAKRGQQMLNNETGQNRSTVQPFNLSTLKPGIYIINGKKFVVK